jgi:drug/metabolite transporter (DMT)-like permease
MMAGLMWVDGSVYQMSCGSIVVFSALLSVTLLKKPLPPQQVAAVGYVIVAIVLVGYAGLQKAKAAGGSGGDDDDSTGEVSAGLYTFGLLMIAAGNFICSYVKTTLLLLLLVLLLLLGCATAAPATTALPKTCYHH